MSLLNTETETTEYEQNFYRKLLPAIRKKDNENYINKTV